jgi:hypothetical protein
MQAQIEAVPSDLTPAALDARRRALPNAYLGELHGWSGTDKTRKRAYRDTGVILER